MVIDESGLEKAIKVAYRGDGYKVSLKQNTHGELEMCFGGEGWEVAVERENVPRKVLGLIAEHLGTLPKFGEAFQVNKDETQTEIFQPSFGGSWEPDEQMRVVRTKVTFMGYPVWQRKGDQKTFLVAPSKEKLFDSFLKVYMDEHDHLCAQGQISRCRIEPVPVLAEYSPVLKLLSGLDWT